LTAYKAKAKTIPPSTAKPPVAALAMFAALDVAVAGALEVDDAPALVEVAAAVVGGMTEVRIAVLLLYPVVTAALVGIAVLVLLPSMHFVQTVDVTTVLLTAVETAVEVVVELAVVDAEYVEAEEVPVTDPEVEEDEAAEEDDEDAPVTWNGRENWKVAGFASEEILNP
jgi:hypothetical protein